MTLDTKKHYQTQFTQTKNSLLGNELPWLNAIRQENLAQFQAEGFPHTKQEAWKYNNLKPIIQTGFQLQTEKPQWNLDAYKPLLPAIDGTSLVFIDGYFCEALSNHKHNSNVFIADLKAALSQKPEFISTYLKAVNNQNYASFSALNNTFMQQGAVINIPANISCNEPILLIYLTSESNNDENYSQHLRNLIIIGENSQATVLEYYHSIAKTAYFTNAITDIHLAKHATLDYTKLQEEGTASYHIHKTQITQQQASTFTSHAFSLGAELSRHDIHVEQQEEYAHSQLNGLYLAHQHQQTDSHTCIMHNKPHGSSSENYKGILTGNSHAIFNGRVVVQPNAQKINAKQKNTNLLLSPKAQINTKPELEIYADDVKCAHGATVGELDADMLFFLRSRGFTIQQAKQILTFGFAKEIADEIALPALSQWIHDKLELCLALLLREKTQ